MKNEIEILKKNIADLVYLLKVSNKALELACEIQDLYWCELWALHENISLVNYMKNMAVEELKKE